LCVGAWSGKVVMITRPPAALWETDRDGYRPVAPPARPHGERLLRGGFHGPCCGPRGALAAPRAPL